MISFHIYCTRYTYEVAPVFVLMERAVLKHMNQLVGFTDGDGIFAPGRIVLL